MYGLPAHLDVAVFHGKKLDLICFSANTVSFSFASNVSITIMGSFIYQKDPRNVENKQYVPLRTSDVMNLINKKRVTPTIQKRQ